MCGRIITQNNRELGNTANRTPRSNFSTLEFSWSFTNRTLLTVLKIQLKIWNSRRAFCWASITWWAEFGRSYLQPQRWVARAWQNKRPNAPFNWRKKLRSRYSALPSLDVLVALTLPYLTTTPTHSALVFLSLLQVHSVNYVSCVQYICSIVINS